MTKLLTIEEFCERARITPSDALSTVRLGMPSGPLSVAWLTADLPIPEPAEVEATVEDAHD